MAKSIKYKNSKANNTFSLSYNSIMVDYHQ
jgi:hypothetical protein